MGKWFHGICCIDIGATGNVVEQLAGGSDIQAGTGSTEPMRILHPAML